VTLSFPVLLKYSGGLMMAGFMGFLCRSALVLWLYGEVFP
jgi:hypothetical protein